MLSALNQAIYNTVSYADIFAFPLTLDELHRYLISAKPAEKSAIERAAKVDKRLFHKNGYYVLRGRSAFISQRKKNEKYVKKKMLSARIAMNVLKWIPTISAIFVTGSVGANNATKDDDVDFMIVTKTGWLWTTRLAVIMVSRYFGKYRTRSTKNVKNMWCFNMWLDETRLAVPQNARNLYTAHEVVQAVPVLNRRSMHDAFLAENRWVKNYLANSKVPTVIFGRRLGESGPLERLCFAVQCLYMQSALTTEKVGLHYAFFHPRNTAKMILDKFTKRGGTMLQRK